MGRVTIPAPLGGVNFQSGIANVQMPECVQLDNWIARPASCESRGGTILRELMDSNEPIRTIAGHPSGFVVVGVADKLWPWDTNTNTTGLYSSGFTESRWNFTLFQSLLILCNASDVPQAFNGTTTFTPLVITGHPAPSRIWGCQTFKGRVYYWQRDAQSFWYAAAGAYQGALAEFDLSTNTIKDGTLLAMVPLTIDGGAGPDDLAAFVFSTGEVLLFQGDDPADANAWNMIGRFYIPNPIGPQSWAITGSATIVGTAVGAVDLARALATGAYDVSAVVGQQITGTTVNNVASPIDNSQLLIVGNDNLLVWARYPADSYDTGTDIQTVVMDLTAKKWSQFKNQGAISGWGATCMGTCNNRLFLGDKFGMFHEYILTTTGDTLATDDAGGGGVPMLFATTQAYTDFGAPANRKRVTAISPVTECDTAATGTTGVGLGFNEDYRTNLTNLITAPNIPNIAGQHSETFYRCDANGFRLGLKWEQTAPFGGTGRYRWIATDVILRTGGDM